MKILVIEDDIDVSNLLAKILIKADYYPIQVYSVKEAMLLMDKALPDLVLLDLNLAGQNGATILEYIRSLKHSNIPVIIISASSALSNKVSLLKSGANDYITKPFEPEEVLARIEVALRNTTVSLQDEVLVYKQLKIFPEARKVLLGDIKMELTAREYDILYLLVKNPHKVYSRETLYELVWNDGYYGENNTVNVHVSNLRKKIKEQFEEEYIETVYGIGFKLC